MARENLGIDDGLRPSWLAANRLYTNRKRIGTAALVLFAVFNLLDLATTSFALANGFREAYLPSLVIMGAAGSLGYAVAKIGYSLLLVWCARLVWRRMDRMGTKSSLAILTLCLATLAVIISAVVNNLAVLW